MARDSAAAAAFLTIAFLVRLAVVSGQWTRGPGEVLYQDIASDYMYRFRVAVTPKSNLAYGILGSSNSIAAFSLDETFRGFGLPVWTSREIPGLTAKQPVLNVDTTTDRVYFMHPSTGRIHCFDASLGNNVTSPVWVSQVVCSLPTDELDQHLQLFSANGRKLLARCNDSVIVLGRRGELLKTFRSASVRAWVAASDLAAPIPVFSNFSRMITWDPAVASLEVWNLVGKSDSPVEPMTTFALPPGLTPSGVSTASAWWTLVTDAHSGAVHIISSYTGKLQSSYNFTQHVEPPDPETELRVSVLPSPAISNGVMYGVVQGLQPSPLPWMTDMYPDQHYWWLFALDLADPKAPALLWITKPQPTRGPLAPQTVWVTSRSVFLTDYQQNGTRGFDRRNGETFFNYPADPYTKVRTQYSMFRGTYKLSLPWVDRDGYFLALQADDWMYDANPEAEAEGASMGNIRTVMGTPFSPPPPMQQPPM